MNVHCLSDVMFCQCRRRGPKLHIRRNASIMMKQLARIVSDIKHSITLLDVLYFPSVVCELYRLAVDRFDERFGTDTARLMSRFDAGIDDQAGANTNMYWPVDEVCLQRMLAAINRPLNDFTFIDIGCGKGRALIVAAQWPFARIEGVDFAPRLVEVATKNIAIVQPKYPDKIMAATLADARHFEFPDQPLVLYFFNPFDAVIMTSVVDKLVQSLRRSPRPCYVLYSYPLCSRIFESRGFTVVARSEHWWSLHLPWRLLRAGDVAPGPVNR